MERKFRKQRGYILVGSLLFSLVLLSFFGLWFGQVIVREHLAENLIELRGLFLECRSLLPVLEVKVKELEPEKTLMEEKDFLIISEENVIRWIVDRAPYRHGGVRFIFRFQGKNPELEPIIVKHSFQLPNP